MTFLQKKRTFFFFMRVFHFHQFGEGSFPGNGNLKLTPEQEKIRLLEKQLKDAELERDILKKAISIFYSLFNIFKLKYS